MELKKDNARNCLASHILIPCHLAEDGTKRICTKSQQERKKLKHCVSVACANEATDKEIVVQEQTLKDLTEDDNTIQVINLHPNILKRTDLQKGRNASQVLSPVKSLTFSPSRFLNIEKFEENGILNENCKVLSFSYEDSGISDMDATLTLPAFSSTPRSRPRRKLLHSSVEKSPDSTIAFRFNSNVMQSTPKSVNNNESKTPLIQKYLNESVMQTPSPFKCPGSEEEKAESILLHDIKLEDDILLADNEFFKKPSPVTSKRKCSVTSQRRKTARKALLLDHPSKSHLRSQHTRAGFFKLSQLQGKRLSFTNIYDHSSLTETTAVVEKRKITPVKSVYFTRRRKVDESVSLSSQWVSVACGRTSDQKDMIAAARRCLDLCRN